MKAWKRVLTVLLVIAVILMAIFLAGRYGWKLGGFHASQGAGITSVEVSEKAVHICDEKKDSFEYWIAGLYQGGQVPEGLKLYTFPESDWALFSARGPLPGSLQTLNTQVWQEWYPKEGQKYMGNGNAMLEVYSPGDMQSPDYECGIWVPICGR